MKKFLAILCVILSLVLVGCGMNGTVSDTGTDTNKNTNDTGIVSGTDSDGNTYTGDLPNEYKTVVADLKNVVDFRVSDKFEDEYKNGKEPDISSWLRDELDIDDRDDDVYSNGMYSRWKNMLTYMTDELENPTHESFGYILKDINSDNTPELFFVREDHTVLAVFTIDEGETELLEVFWPGSIAKVLESGEIYVMDSTSATEYTYSVKRIDSDGDDLTIHKQFGRNDDEFFERIDDQRTVVDEARINELISETPFEHGKSWSKMRL